jgi:hypothetical protein
MCFLGKAVFVLGTLTGLEVAVSSVVGEGVVAALAKVDEGQ